MDKVFEIAVIQYSYKKGLTSKNIIHTDMVATLGNDAPLYATVKRWVSDFKSTMIPALVNFNFQNKKTQQYFTGFQYQYYTTLDSIETTQCYKKIAKHMGASSGHGRISRFINITEFSSPRTMLESKSSPPVYVSF